MAYLKINNNKKESQDYSQFYSELNFRNGVRYYRENRTQGKDILII